MIDCSPKQILVGLAIVPVKFGVVETRTLTGIVFVLSQPLMSVTVNSTLYIPELGNTFETLAPVAVEELHPKSHSKLEVASD